MFLSSPFFLFSPFSSTHTQAFPSFLPPSPVTETYSSPQPSISERRSPIHPEAGKCPGKEVSLCVHVAANKSTANSLVERDGTAANGITFLATETPSPHGRSMPVWPHLLSIHQARRFPSRSAFSIQGESSPPPHIHHHF